MHNSGRFSKFYSSLGGSQGKYSELSHEFHIMNEYTYASSSLVNAERILAHLAWIPGSSFGGIRRTRAGKAVASGVKLQMGLGTPDDKGDTKRIGGKEMAQEPNASMSAE